MIISFMLIFTIPQMLEWVKNDLQVSRITFFALVAIIVSTWSAFLMARWCYFIVYTSFEEALNWFIAGYFIFMFLQTLPLWFKKIIFIAPPLKE